ncbi:MAG: response regulator [Deltaproteobacteria bacterium]|nr:response regulator [Deltaproteobacteria bacterium]
MALVPARVLVVEDDQDIREAVVEAITGRGYEVVEAENGAVALDRMREHAPCIVLLDLMMPVMDGWEVVAQMDTEPSLAAVPICIVSAHDRDLPRNVAVLRKPVSLASLLQTVENYCGPP